MYVSLVQNLFISLTDFIQMYIEDQSLIEGGYSNVQSLNMENHKNKILSKITSESIDSFFLWYLEPGVNFSLKPRALRNCHKIVSRTI